MAVKPQLPKKKTSTIVRLTIFWIVIVFGALLIYGLTSTHDTLKQVPLSDVIKRANAGEISKIEIQGSDIKVTPEGSDKPTERSNKDAASSIYEQGLKPDSKVEVTILPPSSTGDVLWNLDRKSVV